MAKRAALLSVLALTVLLLPGSSASGPGTEPLFSEDSPSQRSQKPTTISPAPVPRLTAEAQADSRRIRVKLDRYRPDLVPARGRMLSTTQKTAVQEISSDLNSFARQHMHATADLVLAAEFEQGISDASFERFSTGVAGRLKKWESAQSSKTIDVWNRYVAPLDRPSTRPDTSQLSQTEQALVEEALAAYAAAQEATSIINEIIGLFVDADTDEHDHCDLPGGVSLHTETYLNVPWRGFELGDNNQEFTAQYIVRVNAGRVDELNVTFRMDLSGSGFDSLDYPIDTTGDSISADSNNTRYRQRHYVVDSDTSFLQIGVVGKVHYGLDGFMTDAGLVPSGTATLDGVTCEFGQGDSIWKYGISI